MKVQEIISAADNRDARAAWDLVDFSKIRELPPIKEIEERYEEIFASWEVRVHRFIPDCFQIHALFKTGGKKYAMLVSQLPKKANYIQLQGFLNNK